MTGRHRVDLPELAAQSVDRIFSMSALFLLIPQRLSGLFAILSRRDLRCREGEASVDLFQCV